MVKIESIYMLFYATFCLIVVNRHNFLMRPLWQQLLECQGTAFFRAEEGILSKRRSENQKLQDQWSPVSLMFPTVALYVAEQPSNREGGNLTQPRT